MKKIIALILALLFVFALSGCENKEERPTIKVVDASDGSNTHGEGGTVGEDVDVIVGGDNGVIFVNKEDNTDITEG